jgi:hypothetical protein
MSKKFEVIKNANRRRTMSKLFGGKLNGKPLFSSASPLPSSTPTPTMSSAIESRVPTSAISRRQSFLQSSKMQTDLTDTIEAYMRGFNKETADVASIVIKGIRSMDGNTASEAVYALFLVEFIKAIPEFEVTSAELDSKEALMTILNKVNIKETGKEVAGRFMRILGRLLENVSSSKNKRIKMILNGPVKYAVVLGLWAMFDNVDEGDEFFNRMSTSAASLEVAPLSTSTPLPSVVKPPENALTKQLYRSDATDEELLRELEELGDGDGNDGYGDDDGDDDEVEQILRSLGITEEEIENYTV